MHEYLLRYVESNVMHGACNVKFPNTIVYYVLSDELHGYLFRPLGSHDQVIKVYNDKITNASSTLHD